MVWEKKWFQFTILLIVALIWGSSFILMKIGLRSFESNQAAAIRIFLASLVLLPYSIRHAKKIQRKDIPSLLVAGFIGSFFPAFLFTKAQTQIDSSMAGMLNSLTPVFTLLVGMIFLKFKYKWIQIVGLILGLGGALGLILSDSKISHGSFNGYALLIVLATSFYAININQIKANLSHLTGVQITSLSFLFIGPAAFGYLLSTDLAAATYTANWGWNFTALAILGIVGTAFAMILMNSLIRYSSAIYASSVTYIIPIFAIVWGLLDGERITFIHISCMAIILLGVYLTNKKVK
ncbi:MAG: DMT family transporter [Prolixibacteraceae bacterium]